MIGMHTKYVIFNNCHNSVLINRHMKLRYKALVDTILPKNKIIFIQRLLRGFIRIETSREIRVGFSGFQVKKGIRLPYQWNNRH